MLATLLLQPAGPTVDLRPAPPCARAGKLRDGLIYRPLDPRSREVEVLTLMAGSPGFPRNWHVEEDVFGRRWLVRPVCPLVPEDVTPTLEHVLQVEQAVRALNRCGWSAGGPLRVAIDPATGESFLLDLSRAAPDGLIGDENQFLHWATDLGFIELVALRRAAKRVLWPVNVERDRSWPRDRKGRPDHRYRHVYAAQATTNLSALRRRGAHLVFPDPREAMTATIRAWVVTRTPLSAATRYKYQLTWGWSPIFEEA